ncbi:MAG: oligosaccharide flippase family protein, partial [Candidatus Sumerlaeaceae bacterium]|nr:oligosaccharide flippase family protein [Candidatus Sumerlaeaceae bacterium]
MTGRSLESSSARSFAKNVGWIGFSFLTARAIGMIVPLFAARYLGREVFGQAALAITVGQFLNMLMLVGMNSAVVRYGAPKKVPREEAGASILVTFVITLAVIAAMMAGGNERVAKLFEFEPGINWAGLIFAVFATFFVLSTSILQAIHKFFERGVGELLTALGVVVGLLGGIAVFKQNYGSYVAAICFGFFIGALYSCYYLARYLGKPQWPSRRTLTVMTAYGLLSLLGNVGFILTFYIQPMILNKLLSTADVGLFRVYQTASITIAQSLSVIFNTVFFPKASASADRQGLWRVTWRLWLITFVPVGLSYVMSQYVLIPVAGAQYPLKPDLIGLFAITSLVITIQATVAQFLGAEGIRGITVGFFISLATGAICISATYGLVPHLQLKGACMALLLAYAVALILVVAAEEVLLRLPTPHAQDRADHYHCLLYTS